MAKIYATIHMDDGNSFQTARKWRGCSQLDVEDVSQYTALHNNLKRNWTKYLGRVRDASNASPGPDTFWRCVHLKLFPER